MKKTSCLLLLLTIAVVSCKGTGDKNPPSTLVTSLGGMTTPKERNYTAAELVIGRRICSALKHKRVLFETLTDMTQQFRFKGELKKCDVATAYAVAEFNASISTASSSDFEYVATTTRPNYFKDVVTDQNGSMKALCESLSASDNVSNTMLSGSSYLTINLLISSGYDRFEVTKRSKDSAGNYSLISNEGVSLNTFTNQATEKFLGVEKERVRNTTCPNSKDFSAVKQTWISAVTPF